MVEGGEIGELRLRHARPGETVEARIQSARRIVAGGVDGDGPLSLGQTHRGAREVVEAAACPAEVGDGHALGVAHPVAVGVGEMARLEHAAGRVGEPVAGHIGQFDEAGDRAAIGDRQRAVRRVPAPRIGDRPVGRGRDGAGVGEGAVL
jgi:hypothetical protein